MSLEGTQLGQYRLLRLIGSGGMGEVYLAEDARINQQVAIKVSRTGGSSYPDTGSASESARLFQREARAIAQLDHPRILPLFTYGEEQIHGETMTYIVMPYRKEGSLVTWLRQHTATTRLNPQDIAYIVTQAADALQYAHDHNIIHQDVKPANFLVRNPNDANATVPDLLLTDFGIAKLSSATSHSSHTVRGTATYMAPEQWIGDPVAATDQYALAVMAYELLTGKPPFQGRQEQLMYAHVNTPPQPPSTLNPRLSGDIDRVILSALAKKPEERFRSIIAFARAFQQAVQSGDAPTVIKPISSNPALGTMPANAPTMMSNNKATNVEPEKIVAASDPIPPTSIYRTIQAPAKQQRRPNGKWLIFVGLALLVILAGVGVYYVQNINKQNIQNNSTATTQALNATGNGSGIGGTSTYTQANTQSVPLATITQLQIQNQIGDVTITVDPNATTPTVSTTKIIKASSQSDANNQFNAITVQVEPAGTPASTLAVNVSVPNSSTVFSSHNGSVNLVITLPPSVNTGNAPVVLNGGSSPINITANGNVSINGLNGVLNVKNASGKITVQNALLSPGSTLETGTGNITFNGTVDTTSGSSNNPSIYIISTEVGNLDVTLPANINVILDAYSNTGTISSDFDLSKIKRPDGSFLGPIGSGSAPNALLKLHVSTGNITLHKA